MTVRRVIIDEAADLWACGMCELIGSEKQAKDHRHRTGHMVERLDPKTAAGVRAEWKRNRDPRGRAIRV